MASAKQNSAAPIRAKYALKTASKPVGLRSDRKQTLPVVALGGSAGSLDGLIEFFGVLPEDCGMAFVVVVHISPNEESNLPELLRRRCALPVLHPKNNQKIEANHVYVIPPGRVLTRLNGHLKVERFEPKRGVRAVIDALFSSMAALGEERVAGIVLSGTDSDGAAGLEQLQKAGGLTMAQDPDEAPHGAMPRASIATGCVAAVLRVAQMPARLLSYFGIAATLREASAAPAGPPAPPKKITANEAALLRKALVCLRERTGRDFSSYRESGLLRHLRRRMFQAGLEKVRNYLEYLQTAPAEPEALVRGLLVSVTGFFRDPEAFHALTQHIPALFKGKACGDFVRVWVPACATGEEAYSLAILLLEHARTLAEPPGIQVFGCDLVREAIEKARAGIYSAQAVSTVGPERLLRFFQKEPGGYRVRRELRQVVLFAEHDVVKDSAFARMDFVSCRNLLIYLNPRGQKRMWDIFEFALSEKGILFLGASEGLAGLSGGFEPLNLKHRIYRRTGTQRAGLSSDVLAGALLAAAEAETRAYVNPGRKGPWQKDSGYRGFAQLHDELEQLRQRLQQTAQLSTPEFKAVRTANQELQVITQELHAAMEELELNRQELRSMNTELSAVNGELSAKLNELERTNSDLTNLMNATAIPTVFLDRELRIMRFTPSATSLFPFAPGDVGRPLAHLHHELEFPELLEELRRVITKSEPLEREVHDGKGRCFLARALPYRTAQSYILGAVLTFVDITARKQAEAGLRESEEQFRAIVSQTAAGICRVDSKGLVRYANQTFCRMLGYDGPEILGRSIWDLSYGEVLPEDKRQFETSCLTGKAYQIEKRLIRKGSSPLWASVSVSAIRDATGKPQCAIAVILDVGDRKRAEADLQARNDELERFDKVTVDRESRMIELKKEVNKLHAQLGAPARYPLAFEAKNNGK
jgi:PAS domain S-box-containing protein